MEHHLPDPKPGDRLVFLTGGIVKTASGEIIRLRPGEALEWDGYRWVKL